MSDPNTPYQQPYVPAPGQVPPPAQMPPAGQVPPGQVPPPAPHQAPKTNTMAIVSLIGSFFIGLVGIICGHIALGQIKKTGEGGKGLAIAGLIIGYIATVTTVIALIMIGIFAGAANQALNELSSELEQSTSEFAVPGDDSATSDGDLDPAYCRALDGLLWNSELYVYDAETPITTEMFVAYKALADSPSEHQEMYEKFYRLLQNFDEASEDEINRAIADFDAVAFADWQKCP